MLICRLLELLAPQPAKQPRRRRIQPCRIPRLKPWCQVLGQRFAQFHAPLVKAVDASDDAGNKDAVFIQGEQGAKRCRCERIQHEGGAGAVAREVLVAGELVATGFAADHEGA